jgi:hypothetical protein
MITPEETLKVTPEEESLLTTLISTIDSQLMARTSDRTYVKIGAPPRLAIIGRIKDAYSNCGWDVTYEIQASATPGVATTAGLTFRPLDKKA